MRKKVSRIPRFKNYKEEANFWDTHSITDFEDETKEVDIVFKLNRPKEETLILRLQKNIKDQLKKIAKRRGVNISTLARIWLTEKLQTA